MKGEILKINYTQYWENVQKLTWVFISKKYKGNHLRAGSDPIIILRDSLQYRIASVFWHLHLLLSRHRSMEKNYLNAHKNDLGPTPYLIDCLNETFYVFDDVLFNLISMFDYLGNTICYLCEGASALKGKWKKANRLARGKCPPLDMNDSAEIITNANNDFVKYLAEIRATLFHYENRKGDMEGTLHLGEKEILPKLKCSVSKNLNKFFVHLISKDGDDSIDLHKSTIDIINSSFEYGNSIIEELTKTQKKDVYE